MRERVQQLSGGRAVGFVVLIIVAALFSSCGDGAGADEVRPRSALDESRPGDVETAPADAQAPSPRARALDAEIDALVTAYEPVTSRASFVRAAHTLYVDAVTTGAGDAVVVERAAALRRELGRSEAVLGAARPALVRVGSTGRVAELRRLLLDAIDARSRAVDAMRLHLDLAAREQPGADESADRFDEQWNLSVRFAREALNLDQDLRSTVEAPAEREDAIR